MEKLQAFASDTINLIDSLSWRTNVSNTVQQNLRDTLNDLNDNPDSFMMKNVFISFLIHQHYKNINFQLRIFMKAEADPEYKNMFYFKIMPLITDLNIYFSHLHNSWTMPSAPQSLTTAELYLTTFLAPPSLSNFHSPAHSPNFMMHPA